MTPKRQDQVFQLSLTEIAFTITFILLLLLGYMLFKSQKDIEDMRKQLDEFPLLTDVQQGLTDAKNQLAHVLQGAGLRNPDEAISKLMAAEQAKAENARLRKRLEELDKELTALAEVKAKIEATAKEKRPDVTAAEVMSALTMQDAVIKAVEGHQGPGNAQSSTAKKPDTSRILAEVQQALKTSSELRRELKDKLDKELPKGKERETVQDVVDAASNFISMTNSGANIKVLQKDNADLRGQVAFLQNRLNANGGRDYPPCWLNTAGKIEFLFAVELRPDGVAVAPAWPSSRDADAKALPGIDAMLAGSFSYAEFESRVRPIFDWSRKQSPECRHYVQLKSTLTDAVQSDRMRLRVENFFYKSEIRR
ncbi:hypothetical protein MKD38_06215 [Cupriavidus sp. WGlv3]|uniref:hypothetical protein n=1 Tax=Cupriavidus sp. WGlv3 TaxID=2919924 RepID=UPI0020917911|nr:hypothetical protein [Cupriavidus sp. WGlv3]MCO4861256.1 hypothetical protein [Cupriavidus sp. WGlv3]